MVKISSCNAGDLGLIPGLGSSPGEGNGEPLRYPFLRNPVDRGACWATVPRRRVRQVAAVAKSLQSCLILSDTMDCSPPGSPVPGILQARTLEWVAISFSNA